jgi:anthranilate 1,2-dioxygenase ferredoxin subunit
VSNWYDIGEPDDFPDGAVKPVVADGMDVAVIRQGDALFALHDLCTHGFAKLSDGYVDDGCIECPLHQGAFDLRSGAPCNPPVTEAVKTFPIRVVAGRVEVEVAQQ